MDTEYVQRVGALVLGVVTLCLTLTRAYIRKHARCEDNSRLDGKTVLITGEWRRVRVANRPGDVSARAR